MSVYPSLTLSAWPSIPLCPAGASQATNRENIQKAISRLDEDLNTLGQMSKLSESLGFPHQVGPSACGQSRTVEQAWALREETSLQREMTASPPPPRVQV